MAICFVRGTFTREDQQLFFGTSRTGIARIDAEVKDELFQGYRADLSVIESDNGELTIVPRDKDKNAVAFWLFVVLPRTESDDGRHPRDAFMIAPGRQGIDCRASFDYLLHTDYLLDSDGSLYDVVESLYDVLVIKAKENDRFCYVRSYGEPWFFGVGRGYSYASTLPDCKKTTIEDSLRGMIVFTGLLDEFYPYPGSYRTRIYPYREAYQTRIFETFSYVFGVAKRVYCGLKTSDMLDIQPDPTGLAVM